LFDDLPGDRLDVRVVRHLRVGHDRGGIAVYEDDLVAFLAERLSSLGAGGIELAPPAADGWAGAAVWGIFGVRLRRHGSRRSGEAAAARSGQTPSNLWIARPAVLLFSSSAEPEAKRGQAAAVTFDTRPVIVFGPEGTAHAWRMNGPFRTEDEWQLV